MGSFTPAVKEQEKLRAAILGPAGSGKSYTSQRLARALVGPNGRIAVIDSERRSARKYAHLFTFDTCELENFSPAVYVEKIKEAEKAGYDVIIIDSLSHAWAGTDGALEQVDKVAARDRNSNKFAAWRTVTPMHNALVDAMMGAKCHIIATLRTKTEYVIQENEKGKKEVKKLGMAAIQRDGMEYEFDVVGDMDQEHRFVVSKTRCDTVDGMVITKPGEDLAELLLAWLNAGSPAQPKPASKPAPAKAAPVKPVPAKPEAPETTEEPPAETAPTPATPEPEPVAPAEPVESEWMGDLTQADPAIRELIEKIPTVLRGTYPTISDEALEWARYLCATHFDVPKAAEIPGDKLEDLRSYMKKDMMKSLNENGMLPEPARKRGN